VNFRDNLVIAERGLIDGATLLELKQASEDLRALSPDSALADLVDSKIHAIEGDREVRSDCRDCV